MRHAVEDGVLAIWLEGVIHSDNAPEVETEIFDCMATQPGLPVLLDAENLASISSAGLRVLLRLIKRQDVPLVMRNVSSDIYDVLEVTGFSQLLQVRRRLRAVSVAGCPVIGRGSMGTVYRLDAETIVKVFSIPDSLPVIEREQQLSRFAFVKGIPTAIPQGAVRVGDGYGSLFELVEAGNWQEVYLSEPDRREAMLDDYVSLLRTLHGIAVARGELPDARQDFLRKLDMIAHVLPDALAEGLRRRLSDMPENLRLVHGDLHMMNILYSKGELVLIDMETLCAGDPVFDLAALFVAYIAFSQNDPSDALKFFGCEYGVIVHFFEGTLRRYIGDDPAALERARQKIELLGYMLFLYKIVALNMGKARLREFFIRDSVEKLEALLPRVDRLALAE